ncbi:MAG: MFS transporter [Proteobacteria bacterium]|nr:MFS transporter [Pseudomonadota bacterium]
MRQNALTAKWPLGLQYFFYFGVMGIFLPYFNLYCYHLDFSGFQIGLLSAARTLAIVIFSLAWGILADRFDIRKPLYVLCNVASALIWVLYLFTRDFWPMLIITIAYSLFYGPIIAFLEAFTMEALAKNSDKRSYGNIRVWGSLNFIIVVMVLGRVIDQFPVNTIVVLILIGSVFQAFFAPLVPGGHARVRAPSFMIQMKDFISPRMIVFLFCSFLMLASHGTYYAFFSIHLEQLGFGRTFIGFAWGLASMAEIVIMLKSDYVFRRFTIRTVLIFSFFAAAIRWLILFFSVSSPMILFAQLLHALTYGAFHIACILYMDELSSKETKTFGQVANNAVSYGLGMMAGFIFNGYFFEKYGAYLYIASSLMSLSGGLIFVFSEKMRVQLNS